MKKFDWRFFICAVLGITGLIGIGIGLAEGSMLIIIAAIIFTIIFVGLGFALKRKYINTTQ
ncbi:DUF5325 family protein [Evansella sp. AB-P1]|uniref:DUF5325 family protein n=1 Tax=Evansella sp. AB-P1 TaxID=3037653 RepID=UPI00241E56FC|nr:DUF5325 family protein [Evansella sp. AB-P1]MDG5789469.1 DUF5325 family protein [Evansella sp. AB-P1]